MIVFDCVPFHDVAGEIAQNMERHHADMNKADDNGPLDLDWDAALGASHMGMAHVVTMRDGERLVGYSIFCIAQNVRHKSIREAQGCGMYVERPYRGRGFRDLMAACDRFLPQMGVNKVEYILNDDMVGRLLGHSGFKSEYKIWSKKYG